MVAAEDRIAVLFREGPRVVNAGIQTFAQTLSAVGAAHVHLDWQPSARGDAELGSMLARLADSAEPGSLGSRIAEANDQALQRLLAADPVWEDVRPASEVWPRMAEARLLLHAGPPIEWERMCGPMKGAIVGAMLFEGWASSPDEAAGLAESGAVEFAPCHHVGAVGPMAGVVAPSMPVCVVRNAAGSNLAYATLNEGLGKVLRYGAYGPDVMDRLGWMRDVVGPALGAAVRRIDGVQLKSIIAQALQMGDECHNRNVAATSLTSRILAPALVEAVENRSAAGRVLQFMADNNHFFLNLSMAACKAGLDSAHGIPYSTMVTAMARNGVDFGIRVSGLGDRWFTGPANIPDGLYFPGFTEEDAAPDLGDSAITETAGIGGFAIGAAPAIVKFVGGSPEDALAYTEEMYQITLGRNPSYSLPALSFAGTPTGIDVRKVLDSNVLPLINTGIAHKEPGIGQIGAGLVRPPVVCFDDALRAIYEISFQNSHRPEAGVNSGNQK
jgi:hypothetical protein